MWWRKDKTAPGEAAQQTEEQLALLGQVLLVVDGSEPSIAAARFAVELSAQMGCRVTAVYVVDTATMDYLLQSRIFVSEERQEFERDLESTGQRYLDFVTTIAANRGIQVATALEKGSWQERSGAVASALLTFTFITAASGAALAPRKEAGEHGRAPRTLSIWLPSNRVGDGRDTRMHGRWPADRSHGSWRTRGHQTDRSACR